MGASAIVNFGHTLLSAAGLGGGGRFLFFSIVAAPFARARPNSRKPYVAEVIARPGAVGEAHRANPMASRTRRELRL